MAQITGKKAGILSKFVYTDGAGAPQTFKSLTGWEMDISVAEIESSDHDTLGWGETTPGLAKWKASVKGFYYEGDATQVGILTALTEAITGTGGLLACQFIPQVNSGNKAWTGNGKVVGVKAADGGTGGMQALDINIAGVGPIALTAQP